MASGQTISARRHLEPPAKTGRKILAGVKPVAERNFRDRPGAILFKLMGGVLQTAPDQELNRSVIYQFASILRERRDSHPAMGGHFFQSPRLAGTGRVGSEIAQKEVHRAPTGCKFRIFMSVLPGKGGKEAEQELVEPDQHV